MQLSVTVKTNHEKSVPNIPRKRRFNDFPGLSNKVLLLMRITYLLNWIVN